MKYFVRYSAFVSAIILVGCENSLDGKYNDVNDGMSSQSLIVELGTPSEDKVIVRNGVHARQLTWSDDADLLIVTLIDDKVRYKTHKQRN